MRPIAGTAADLFDGRLFEIAPQVRGLFPDDMTAQKQKLMAMLGLAVANLNQPETMVPALQDLGRKHCAYGTQAAHGAPVGDAPLWTLEQGLGPDLPRRCGRPGSRPAGSSPVSRSGRPRRRLKSPLTMSDQAPVDGRALRPRWGWSDGRGGEA